MLMDAIIRSLAQVEIEEEADNIYGADMRCDDPLDCIGCGLCTEINKEN
jgi:hypothetical protein